MKKILKYTAHDSIECDLYVVDNTGQRAMPFFCSVCEFVMNSHDDFKAIQRFNCCSTCEMTFAQPNREKWDSGWRPSEEELNSYKGRIIGQSLNLFLDDQDN